MFDPFEMRTLISDYYHEVQILRNEWRSVVIFEKSELPGYITDIPPAIAKWLKLSPGDILEFDPIDRGTVVIKVGERAKKEKR